MIKYIKHIFLVFVSLHLGLLGMAQLNGTYTIGGTSPDYATVAAAVSSLNSSGVSGPVTFNVRSGTYSGQISITSFTGASAINTVLFRKDPGAATKPIITHAPSSSGNNYVIWFNGCKYVEFEGLEIKTTALTYSRVIAFGSNNEHNTIDSCTLSSTSSGTSFSNNSLVYATALQRPKYFTFSNNIVTGGYYGIYLSGIDTISNPLVKPTISGNTFTQVINQGIYLNNSDSATVKDNHVKLLITTTAFAPRGIVFQYGTDLLECSGNEVIADITKGMVGISIDRIWCDVASPGRVFNNMVSLPNTNSNVSYGMELNQCKNVDVNSNTVLVKSTSFSSAALFETGSTGSTFKNNIFSVTNSTSRNAVYSSNGSNLTLNNNCYVHPSNKGPNASNSLAGWWSTTGGGRDTNSIIASITFTSDTNLRTTDSDLKQKGTTISYITTDIDGQTRNTPPDIGADEFTAPPTTMAGTYTIGGVSPDFLTFKAATDSVVSKGVHGPVTFNVRQGTYTEQIAIDSIAGASPTNTITFQKDPASSIKPVLTYSAVSALAYYTVLLDGADYITFRNLEISATSTNYGNAVQFKGYNTKITIDSCELIGTTGTSDLKTVIYSPGSSTNLSDSVTISNCTILSGYKSIAFYGGAGTNNEEKGNVIINNKLLDYAQGGLKLSLQKGMQVIGNELVGLSGSQQQYGIDLGTIKEENLIKSNSIVHNTSAVSVGIFMLSSTGTSSNKITIENNTYRNAGVSNSTDHGIDIRSNSYVDIYYNTMYIKSSSAISGNGIYITSNSNVNVKNNIFHNAGGGVAYRLAAFPSGFDSDYNNLYSSGSVLGYANGADRVDLAAWKAGSFQGTNSKNINPIFISDSVLKPNNGNLNNSGTVIAGITTDIEGNTRNLSNPDIGAYEFTGVAPPCTLLSGSYTVGGTSPDYATIQEAVDSLVSIGVCGPVTMNIRSGTYNEQITIDTIPGSSLINTVKFRTEPSAASKAIVKWTTSYTIKLDSAVSNISFDSLQLETTSGSEVVLLSGTNNNISFTGNIFTTSSTSNYLINDGNNSPSEGISIIGNTFLNSRSAIRLYGGVGSSSPLRDFGCVIKNNVIQGFSIFGIIAYDHDSLVIEGNIIQSVGNNGVTKGIEIYNGSAFTILYNEVFAVGSGQGVPIFMQGVDGRYGRSLVANNMFSSSGATQLMRSSFEEVDSSDIVFNNFYGETGSYDYEILSLELYANSKFQNNTVFSSGAGYAVKSTLNTSAVIDYNNIYGNGGESNIEDGTMGIHSISVDPLYVSDTNLLATAPDLIGRGISMGVITSDIDGNTRKTSPDIGAHERIAAPTDVRFVNVVVPQTCVNDSAQISVLVRNVGSNAINSLDIGWSISSNNGARVLQTTKSLSLSLAPYSDSIVNIEKIQLQSGIEYDVWAYPMLPNGIVDTVNYSDTAKKVFKHALSGVYTVGGVSPDYASPILAVQDLINNGVCGPVTFQIRSGTYTGQLSMNKSIVGLSSLDTVLFVKDPASSAMPVLTFAATDSKSNWVIGVMNNSFITFDSLHIKPIGVTYAGGIQLEKASNIAITRCKIEGVNSSSFSKLNVFLGNFVSDVNITDCNISGGRSGIYASGSSTSSISNILVSNNSITGFDSEGIYFRTAQNINISGNLVVGGAGTNSYGIYARTIDIGQVVNNKVRVQVPGNKRNYGIETYDCKGTTLLPFKIYNNEVISGDTGTTLNVYGLVASYIENGEVYYNSIEIKGTASNMFGLSVIVDSADCDVKNNNVVNHNLTGNSTCISLSEVNSGIGKISSDYNNLYGGKYIGRYGTGFGTYKLTLADFVSGNNTDSNSVSLDPVFESDSVLKPTNLLLDNLGTPLAGITYDIVDSLRSSLTPDMGAYSFGIFEPCLGLSGTYTIGGTSPYFATIGEAVDSLNIKGVCDSVVFNIRQGTYNGKLSISEFTNPDNYKVIFQADPANTLPVLIQDSLSTAEPTLLALDTVGNIYFKNLNFEVLGYSGSILNTSIVNFQGDCGDFEFSNCSFNGNDNVIYGIGRQFFTNAYSLNNIKFDSCDISNAYLGLKLEESKGTLSFLNSHINNISQIGFSTANIDSVSVLNSYINAKWGLIEINSCKNAKVIGNTLHSTVQGVSGILAIGVNVSNPSNGIRHQIINNSIYIKENSALSQNPVIELRSSSNADVLFNSVHIENDKESSKNRSMIQFENTSYGHSVKNNVFSLKTNGYIYEQLNPNSDPQYNNLEIDYNNLYAIGDTLAKLDGVGYTSINELRTLSYDSNSFILNPIFNSDTTLLVPHVSELVSAGTPISSVTTDIDSNPRSGTNPSIGAYEYTYVCGGLRGTYTIGGTSPDYTTIAGAVADLNSLGICDDVTFNIRQGTYTEEFVFEEIYNAGDSGRVTFQSDPTNNAAVLIQDTLSAADEGLYVFNNSGYIEFKSIDFGVAGTSGNTSGSSLIQFRGINNPISFIDCEFDGDNHVTQLLAENFNYPALTNNLVIDSCAFKNADEGISLIYNGPINDREEYLKVEHSQFDVNNRGIYAGGDSVFIRNNYFESINGLNSNKVATQFFDTKYLLVEKNKIHFDGQNNITGVFIEFSPGPNHILRNNEIVLTGTNSSGAVITGISAFNITGLKAEYNTVLVSNITNNVGDVIPFKIADKAGSVELINNNLVNTTSGKVFESIVNATTSYNLVNNNLFTNGDTLLKIDAVSYASLADVNSATFANNTVSLNPYFLSDTLLKPYRLAIDNKGVSIAGITEDITGETRGVTPDIGAYEFDPIVYDVLVDSVRVDTLCEGLHGVSAFIKNTGDSVITDLRFVTSVQAIGGAVQESDILVVSNTLQPNDSMWVSTGSFQFTANLSYIVKARIDTINGYLDNEPNDNVSFDTLSTKPKPDAFITQSQACDGDSLRLFAIGGVSYEWFGPGGFTDSIANPKRGSIDSSYIGDYTVIAMDSNFCIDSATITLGLDTAPAINFPTNADSICDGFSKTISAEVNPFHTYLWNIGETSPNITVDSVYNYIVTVTNQNGCSSTDTFRLDTFSVPVLVFTDTVSLVCENSAPILLNIASPAGGYYSSALVSGDTLYPSNFGVYPLSYIYGDTNTGCSAVIDTVFTIRKAPSVTISPLPAICLNAELDTIIEHAPKGGSFFNSPAMSDSIYNPLLAGPGLDTISYQFSNVFGCTDTAYQTILVQDTLAISLIDTTFCENKGSILLEQPTEVYSGISGSYSGSSALVGNYFRTGNGLSQQTLNFSVTDTNNCISRQTRTITIDTIPIVVFSDASICINAGTLPLNSATPSGGVYWGTGVNNDSLDPVVMGLGLDTVFYAYELPSNGCIDTAESLTYINPAPIVNLTLPDSTLKRCENAIPAILSGQSPLGGTFSGVGISSNGLQFLADTAGAGVHPITYSFTNSLGCTSTAIDTIEVFELPIVTFALYDSICENSVPDTLNGGLPLGGFYSGSGVNSFGVFRPNLVGAKTAHTITYNYTDTITGCYNFIDQVVRIDSLTPISLGLIPDYCINVGVDTLIQGSINSGSYNYFGNGITNGNEFDPVLAGLGAYSIGYEFTNLRGCSDSLYQTIEVFDTSNVSLNIPVALSELCTNDAPFTLSYGLPLGGFYDTLTGIVGNQFNPSISGPGSKTIRYTYSNSNNCVTSKSQTIVVNSVPVVTHLADSFCFNGSTQVLSNGLPFGGKYTGSGMVNDSIFNPLFSGVGSVQVTYTYSEPITGCTNSAVASYTVFAAPTVSLSNLSAVCENKTAFNLNAGSSNGTLKYYSGNGITDSILGTFNPSIAQSGSHLITYIALNNAGCSDTISKTIKVDTIPVVTIDTLADLCAGAASFSLTIGNPKLNGTGIYTGQGVSGKTYFPSVSGVGTDEIIYQFTDLKGCKSSDTTTLTINALPKMVAAKWNSYCVGGDSVVLNGSLPVGGIYSNSLFVDSSTQKMAIDSVGIWSINYAYTDTNGCSNSILQSLQVRDLPSVSLSFPSSFCSKTPLQPLTGGSPLGASGVYKGDGVVGNFYNVDSVALSSDTLWYIYSDIYGCTDSVFQAISIDTLTSLTAIGISDLCEGSANVNLEPYFTPAGGKFSGFNVIGNQFFTSLLSEGSYPITYNYTDSNNCKNSIIDTVQIRSNPTATISNDTSMCTGETIRLIASGGLSYEWNTGERSSVIQVAPDSTSSYSVEVTNEFNCSVQESVLVTVYENFGVFTSSIEASCGANNGSGSVTVVNGKLPIQYFWSTGDRNSSASGLMAGTYTITILDGNSCEQYASLDVSNVDGPKIVVDSVKDNLCYGASDGLVALSVNSSIPSTAIWSNGSKTNSISNLSNGLYSVSIKDSLGCSSNRTFEIKSPDELTISYEVISPLCDSTNGHIIVFVEGGTPNYNYNWLGQSNTTDLLSNVGAGEYNLEVFDGNQCLDTFSFNLNNVGGPEFRLDSILSVDCGSLNGGVYITAIDTVKSYLWSNGKTVGANSGITVGTYTVTITDTSNCISTESFVVDYSPSAMASLCYITYDTSNGGYNEIVWDTVGMNSVDGYSIYRESAEKGQYSLLGNVAKGLAPVFVDSSLNSQLAVGNYAIETYNACAKSESLSPIHKSILLTTQEIGNDIVQINWSGYQGIDVTGYHVFRYSTTEGFKLLDSTAVNVRSYNDYDAPKEESELFYFVIARGKDVCTPEGSIVSNFSRDFGTGIFISTQQPIAHFDFEVYPNPNKGEFNVKFNNNSSQPSLMRVYNTQGQIVFEKTLSRIESEGSYSIKLRDISDGLYYLQLIGSGEIKTTQVIINQ